MKKTARLYSCVAVKYRVWCMLRHAVNIRVKDDVGPVLFPKRFLWRVGGWGAKLRRVDTRADA